MSRATFRGLPIAPGLGFATVFRMKHFPFVLSGAHLKVGHLSTEIARLEEAWAGVCHELLGADDQPGIAGTTLLHGPLFHGSVIDRLQAGFSAEDSVVQTTNDLVVIFGEHPDPVLRANAEQAEEIGHRLFRRLHGFSSPSAQPGTRPVIVTDEMTAFDATRLRPQHVAGIVTERGGVTSHFAIVAKQLGIPAVSGVQGVLEVFQDGEPCICDGTEGLVHASPDSSCLQAVQVRMAVEEEKQWVLGRLARAKTVTRDGKPVALWGNITGALDVQAVLDAGGSGVGMFRTEFIFMGDEAPSEERQAYIYAEILRKTGGPVVMRTLEAGGDKTIPYLAGDPEENPNLGWQGLRMCLDKEDLFLAQLRAMLRASIEGDLWIMFPFVSALWELRKCRELVAKADSQVRSQGVTPGPYRVGIMVEVPSAALLADDYLKDFDFCSIGTNDLTQFTLAADRMNPKVARWYDPMHPAVLRLIAMTARAAHRARKPIGMAGDMASNPLCIPFLIGLGFDFLSATAPRIPEVKKTILSLDSRFAGTVAHKVLAMNDADDIRQYLKTATESDADLCNA